MAADQLVRRALERLGEPDAALLAEQFEAEDHQEPEVAELLGRVIGVAGGDRFDGFDRFLGQVGRHRLERLLAVPRASVGAAKPAADSDELLECGALTVGHGARP